MQKVKVLLPEPLLNDLREIAAAEDRPLSEVVRRAAEQLVRNYPAVRTFDGGAVLAGAEDLRALAYEADEQ